MCIIELISEQTLSLFYPWYLRGGLDDLTLSYPWLVLGQNLELSIAVVVKE